MSKEQQERRFLPRRPSMFAKLKSALVLMLVILLGSLGFYYFHVQKKSDYLTSRNFRLLTSMGERITNSVQAQGWILKHLSKTDGFMTALDSDLQRKSEILRVIAPQFESVQKVTPKTAETGRDAWHELQPGAAEPRIKSSFPVDGTTVLEGVVRLSQVIGGAMAPRGAFESVLLADSKGRVIRQEGAFAFGITNLQDLMGSAEGRSRPLKAPDRLLGVSGHRVIDLAGKEHRLFVEPFSLPLRSSPAGGHQET